MEPEGRGCQWGQQFRKKQELIWVVAKTRTNMGGRGFKTGGTRETKQ